MKNIQPIKNFELNKTTPTIIYQANHKDKDLDLNIKKLEKKAKNNDKQWVQQ